MPYYRYKKKSTNGTFYVSLDLVKNPELEFDDFILTYLAIKVLCRRVSRHPMDAHFFH